MPWFRGRPRVFFCHVPKCGGLSVARAIRCTLYPPVGLGVRPFWIELEASRDAAEAASLKMARARQVILGYQLAVGRHRFGAGHAPCPPGLVDRFAARWSFVTLLRNPVDRWISEYVYNTYKGLEWQKNELPLEQYLGSEAGRASGSTLLNYFSNRTVDSSISSDKAIDEAVENLGRFDVVGTTSDINRWRDAFQARFGASIRLGARNTSPNAEAAQRIRREPGLLARIEALCEADTEVYRRVLDSL